MTVFRCPLCNSTISKSIFDRVTGILKERKKLEQSLRKDAKLAVERGKASERRRAKHLSDMVQAKTKKIQALVKTVGELRDQLRKGTTPQVEGLNLEEDLTRELRDRFRGDKIQRFGKKADILQTIFYRKAVAGSILYECKRTQRFSRKYVAQTKRAMVTQSATYGVLVTTSFPTNSAGFTVSEDVFVVHPFGASDLAEFLRKGLIEMQSLKISGEQKNQRGRVLLEYARTEDFRNAIQDSIHSTHALRDLLVSEVRSHFLNWKKRLDHYRGINRNTILVGENARRIIRGEPTIKRIDETQVLEPVKELPA